MPTLAEIKAELAAQSPTSIAPSASMRQAQTDAKVAELARSGWTPQAVGAFILAPVIGLFSAWLMRAPAPPPDAPTRAELVELKAELASARSDASAARLDCAVARESASVARSRAGAAEAVADSAVKR